MKGCVYWLTGLSGAGKTTIGQKLYQQLKSKQYHTVFLDGDKMRDILGVSGAFSYDQRKQLSFTYSRLCKSLTDQGIDVVCATISMFDDVRAWNREHFANYKEIYVKCPLHVLQARDAKGIYNKLANDETSNVAGFDMQVEEPKFPDLILINDGSEAPETMVNQILELK